MAGYNAQVGNILLGLEAGANAFDFDASRSGTTTFISDPNLLFTVTNTIKSDWIATLRPRLGWVQDNWLLYVTGGLAWTRRRPTSPTGMTMPSLGPGCPVPGPGVRRARQRRAGRSGRAANMRSRATGR